MKNKESEIKVLIKAVGRTSEEADQVAVRLLRSGGLPEGAVVVKVVEEKSRK